MSDPFPHLGKRSLGQLYQLSMERIVKLEEGHVRCFEESDYCYCCNCHPSSGHADDCPFSE